jgi:hypothetical protein
VSDHPDGRGAFLGVVERGFVPVLVQYQVVERWMSVASVAKVSCQRQRCAQGQAVVEAGVGLVPEE